MAINQELLSQIEASADDWGPGPAGKYGNEEDSVRAGKEDGKMDERLAACAFTITTADWGAPAGALEE